MRYFLQQAAGGGGATGVHNRILAEYQVKDADATQDELMGALESTLERETTDGSGSRVASGIQGQNEELKHREAFRMPDWLSYSSRKCLTLEGVSLQLQPDQELLLSMYCQAIGGRHSDL